MYLTGAEPEPKKEFLMDLDILYEDNHLVAINKPPGTLSQKDISGRDSLIEFVKEYIKEKYGKPGKVFIGTIHRLDRPVTGVLLFARTSKAAERLFEQFSGRKVIKIYLALVRQAGDNPALPSEWTMQRNNVQREGDRTITVESGHASREALMEYRCIDAGGGYALLLVRLHTGRKHQIRAQLAALGLPIVGDEKYGSAENNRDGSICLHSLFIRFRHPVRDEMIDIIAGVPRIFSERSGLEISAGDIAEKFIIHQLPL